MHHAPEAQTAGLSRRNLFLGAGALASAGVVGVLAASPGSAAPRGEDLTYVNFDGFLFRGQDDSDGEATFYDRLSGLNLLTPPGRVYAPLSLPVGVVIHQLTIAYQGQPIVEISRRGFDNPALVTQVFQQTTAAGGGPKTQTFDLATPVTIEPHATYTLSLFLASNGGNTVYGMTVGYTPPA